MLTYTAGILIDQDSKYFLVASSVNSYGDTATVEFVVAPVNPTLSYAPVNCTAGVAQSDGKILLTDVSPTVYFDLVQGATYTGIKTYATAASVPGDAILGAGLPNPASLTVYIVRLFTGPGCFQDLSINLLGTNCACPVVCLPVSIQIVRRR